MRHPFILRAVAALAAIPLATTCLAGTPLEDPIPEPIPFGSIHVELETVATGLTAPNWGTSAPGVPGRLYVTDQDGILWSIDLDTGDKAVFLDVTGMIVSLGIFGPGSFDERGLLGVAFHPEYAANGLVYTYTSEPAAGGPADFTTMPEGETEDHHTVIREWSVVDPSDPDAVVDAGSTRVLVRIAQPQFNHNAGAIEFGHDGKLYIALGDGGGADDQDGQQFIGQPLIGHGKIGNGQDTTNPLGAILRIDPLGPDGTLSANGEYFIPLDNPFVGGDPDAVNEIFLHGFRNPFRFSVDQATGDLYIADVGQNDIEEIDHVSFPFATAGPGQLAGGNFGWRHKEGSFFFDPAGFESGDGFVTDVDPGVPEGLIDPIAEYDHDEGIAIVGGFVYRGGTIASLAGRYVFGEFAVSFANDGRLFYLGDDDEILEFNLVGQEAPNVSVLGFGQDADGEVYLLANTTGVPFEETGIVLRLTAKLGDIDNNGVVDGADLGLLLGAWNTASPAADLNGDGNVDGGDLGLLLGAWG